MYVEHNKKSNNLLLIKKANYKILFKVKFRLKNYMSESTIYISFRLKNPPYLDLKNSV